MFLNFYRQMTIFSFACTKIGAPKWAKKGARYREISRRDDISTSVPKIRDMDTISRYIVSCDITWYGIWYHEISRYIMQYHTGSPRNTTGKYKFNENPPPRCGLLLFFRLCLCPNLGLSSVWHFFVVFLLSIRWTHHRTDRITSKQQPCPLKTRPAPWAHVCFVSFFDFFFLSFRLFLLYTWYVVLLSTY